MKANVGLVHTKELGRGEIFLCLCYTYSLSITSFAVQTMCSSFPPLHMEIGAGST